MRRRGLTPSLGLAALAGVAAFGFGCGDGDGVRECGDGGSDNTLSGSYCEGVNLSFTEVYLLLVDSTKAVRIEYVNGDRSAKTLQIIAMPGQEPFEVDVPINLVERGASVRRFVPQASEAIDLASELEATSQLVFSAYEARPGARAAGQFNLLFKSGRTLSGTFSGEMVDAFAATGG